MAQYYKTSRTPFVDDFMYEPPYDLYKEVIKNRDTAIDEGVESANSLSKVLDFNTLDFDKQAASNKKLYYQSKIEDLTTKIKKDPENYTKYTQDIYNLKKELTQDFTSGDISAMVGDYNSALKFEKDHEKFKVEDPTRYGAGYKAFMNNAREAREKSGYVPVWNSEQLMKTVDFRKGFVDYVSKMKPNTTAYANSGSKNGFIFKNKGTKESLSEKEVVKLMEDYILSTPNIDQYLAQSNRIGLPEDLSGLEDFAKNYAYSKSTADSQKTRDPLSMIGAKEESAKRLAKYKQELAKDLFDHKNAGKAGETYNGEMQTSTMRGLLGDSMIGQLYTKNGLTNKELDPNTTITYGMPALIGAGIVSPKQEAKMTQRINNYSKSLESFGTKQIVFVPTKEMKVKSTKSDHVTTLHANKTYIMTADKAKRLGLIKNVVKDSGQPFYIDDNYNGAKYNFITPSGEYITGSLMPTGAHPSLKEGVQILNNNE